MKNLKNFNRYVFRLVSFALFNIFLIPGVLAQNAHLQGPKNLLYTDLTGFLQDDYNEFAFSYERRLNKRASLVGTFGFLGDQDKGHLVEGFREQEYTEIWASGWQTFQIDESTIFTDRYSNRTTYERSRPWLVPGKTAILTGAGYVKAGYKIYKVNNHKINQRAHWYIMPELLLSLAGYNDYEITEERIPLGHQVGYTELPWQEEAWEKWDIRQTWDVQKQKRTQLVLGGLANVGYQHLLFKRIVIGVQGTAGVLLPTDGQELDFGRGGKKNLYYRISLMAGVAF